AGANPWWAVAAAAAYAASLGPATRAELEGRFDWLLPTIARTAEYAGVLTITAAVAPAATPAAFTLLAASAFRHYDAVYRLRARDDGNLDALAGGHEGRIVVVAVAVALAPAHLGTVLVVLAAVTAVTGAAVSVQWLRGPRVPRAERDAHVDQAAQAAAGRAGGRP
ncbi:MAG: DUF5941 domain-containing protein, partial [Actinomycetota bacterium]|nr:DUF5941 domain-containing protein [Actinomycetota bacterium]